MVWCSKIFTHKQRKHYTSITKHMFLKMNLSANIQVYPKEVVLWIALWILPNHGLLEKSCQFAFLLQWSILVSQCQMLNDYYWFLETIPSMDDDDEMVMIDWPSFPPLENSPSLGCRLQHCLFRQLGHWPHQIWGSWMKKDFISVQIKEIWGPFYWKELAIQKVFNL